MLHMIEIITKFKINTYSHSIDQNDHLRYLFKNIINSLIGGEDYKIIYRHYATLYFVFCVDSSESELGILDLIQVFVETLDKSFENVCELDLIFNVDKVHHILNELVMGGMVLETNMNDILNHVEEQSKLERQESGLIQKAIKGLPVTASMAKQSFTRTITSNIM